MATFTNSNRNTASFSNTSKNSASFSNYLRHGKAIFVGDLANKTFTDTVFNDAVQIKDMTFEQLSTDQVWTNTTKN